MTLALICALLALLPAIFLALPLADQQAILRSVAAFAQNVGPSGLQVALEVLLVVFACASFALLLAPGYRQHRYLTLPTSLIAPISVYVDAENIKPRHVPALVAYLRKFLDGRRADLLYFMDAEFSASRAKYKALYRFGFRPVDVPHDPTGEKEMREAVDRELAMHAFERALLGPPGQEFIIVSSDADFAPLVYRLVGRGHRVQIWSTSSVNAYVSLKRYLPFTWVDLSQALPERSAEAPNTGPSEARRVQQTTGAMTVQSPDANHSPTAPRPKQPMRPTPTTPRPNQSKRSRSKLYYVRQKLFIGIAATLKTRQVCERRYALDTDRNEQFRRFLTTSLAQRMAGVGYSGDHWPDVWLGHLEAAGVLVKSPGVDFPSSGATSANAAARLLFAMARASAEAAMRATSNRSDGLLSMQVILAQFEAAGSANDVTPALRALVAPEHGQRTTHMRYFLRCARALGLIQFDDVASSADLIANPRIEPPDAPHGALEAGGDNSASNSV